MVSELPNLAGLDQVALATNRLLLSVVLPFLLMLAATTCLYRYLPYRSPAWRHALVGGLLLTVLWELAKHLFSLYLGRFSVYSRIYGPLLTVVVFLLWIYYSAALFLYSAAVVHGLDRHREGRRG